VDWTLHLHSRLRRGQILAERASRAEQRQATEPLAAEAELRKVAALCRRHLGDRDPDTLDAALALGQLRVVIGRHADAVQTLDALIAAYDVSQERHRMARCHARAGRAAARSELGDVEWAEQELREVIDEARAEWGDEDATTLHCRKQLASVFNEADRFAEAVELMDDVVRGYARVLGPSDRITLCARHSFGLYLVDAGEFDRAEEEFTAAMSPYGRHMSCLLICTYGFGRVAAGRGLREEAVRHYEEAIQGWTALFGADYFMVGVARHKMAELYG
jgi:tetratricopeptide (TPR) repeat protein